MFKVLTVQQGYKTRADKQSQIAGKVIFIVIIQVEMMIECMKTFVGRSSRFLQSRRRLRENQFKLEVNNIIIM